MEQMQSPASTSIRQRTQGESRQSLMRRQSCCKPRKVGSKGAVLVLVWSCLVCGSFLSTIDLILGVLADDQPSGLLLAVAIVLSALCSPFIGWIAGVYCGRYKVICTGLWLMWFGSTIVVLVKIMELRLPEAETILQYSVVLLAAIVITLGFSTVIVNALPFGTDQMPDASAEEISALVYWFVWSLCGVGQLTPLVANLIPACTHLTVIKPDILQTLVPATLSSLALCCNFLFKEWLIFEPVGLNPFKLVLRVLKFAMTHKHPIRRSAFTHCEDVRPCRIDFAKSKYGGPFTTEEVEDVKTCLRILVIILCMCTLVTPFWMYQFSIDNLPTHFTHLSEVTPCYDLLISLTYLSLIIISIPLYEILIHRVVRTIVPSMMKRIGISTMFTIVLSLMTLLVDTVGHLQNHSLPCMFQSNGSSPVIEVNYLWIDVLINVLTSVQVMLFGIASLEFICAQAPYNLKGFLIGLSYSVYYATISLTYIIYSAWRIGWTKTVTQPSCGFWYYLFTALTATLGLVIWCIVAKWYKRRERGEPAYTHTFVVDYYDKYCGSVVA